MGGGRVGMVEARGRRATKEDSSSNRKRKESRKKKGLWCIFMRHRKEENAKFGTIPIQSLLRDIYGINSSTPNILKATNIAGICLRGKRDHLHLRSNGYRPHSKFEPRA